MPDSLLPVGSRIRFKQTIIEPATGSHPEFLMCEAGTLGQIVGHRTDDERWPYSVLWDRWKKAPFAIGANEIEVIDAH